MPNKLRTSDEFVGGGAFLNASTFLSSGLIPSPKNVKP